MTETAVERVLLGGEQVATPEQVFAALDQLQIKHSTITHKPVSYTHLTLPTILLV